MALGLLDLSIVTDRLIDQLNGCTNDSSLWIEDTTAKFTISYTGLAPDAARKLGGCQVSVYLFHVAADKFYRNTYPTAGNAPTGVSAQRIPEQPLGLTLYYLLTAYSEKSYIQEQQAMSIALKCFHEHPIVTALVPVDSRPEEFTLTLESQTLDELGRLWQAISTPMRLSAVYRASVVFVEPPPPKEPKRVEHLPQPLIEADYSEPIVSTVTAAADGSATVTIAGARLVAGAPAVQIRPLSGPARPVTLHENSAGPPGPGEFRVVDATTLEIKVPVDPINIPTGRRYLLHVLAARGQRPVEIWLDVP